MKKGVIISLITVGIVLECVSATLTSCNTSNSTLYETNKIYETKSIVETSTESINVNIKKEKIKELKKAKKGSTVKFGTYEQDNDIVNGKETIDWIVLQVESDKILVISKCVLDCQQFNNRYDKKVTWETCSLRKWLNNIFLNNAFDSIEQDMIQNTTVYLDKKSNSKAESTIDKLFILSKSETEKYFKSDEERGCKFTDYCKSKTGNRFWWSRTESFIDNAFFVISESGKINNSIGYHADNKMGIRPAMWIKFGS